jgi:hypothetical protein
MMKALQTIKEEEEHEAESRDMLAEMHRMGLSPGTPSKRNMSFKKGERRQSSAGKGSFAEESKETEEERREREFKEYKDKFEILNKDDAKVEMAKKEFDEFIGKTTRIVERALDQEFDVIGDFFGENNDEEGLRKQKGEKLTK